MCMTQLLIMHYLSVKFFFKFASVVYEQHEFRHNLTSDPVLTLTLGVGT